MEKEETCINEKWPERNYVSLAFFYIHILALTNCVNQNYPLKDSVKIV